MRAGTLIALALSLPHLALAQPAETTRPDVVLVTLDTVRADAPGFAGNAAVATPVLDRLAAAGRLSEAELEGREALKLYLRRLGRYSTYTAEALVTLADILLEQNRPDDAARLANTALDIRSRIGADTAGSAQAATARLHPKNASKDATAGLAFSFISKGCCVCSGGGR